MKTMLMTTLLLATALLPMATAQGTCAEMLCLNQEAVDEGDSCGDSDYWGYRGVSATVDDGESTTGAYFYEYCWSYDNEYGQGEGRAHSVTVSHISWETWQWDGVTLWWEEAQDANHGSYCGMMVHGHATFVSVFQPVECVAGAPPALLFLVP